MCKLNFPRLHTESVAARTPSERTSQAMAHRRKRRNVPTHIRANRRLWEGQSKQYDSQFKGILGGSSAMSWGFWRIPETKRKILGAIERTNILELGCGAARWSCALAKCGALAVGLEFSMQQLR